MADLRRHGSAIGGLVAVVVCSILTACPVAAQSADDTPGGPKMQAEAAGDRAGEKGDKAERPQDRLFGAPPSEAIVERHERVKQITTADAFRLASRESFDPHGFLFVGAWAGLSLALNDDPAWGTGWSGYSRRYVTGFSDNTIATMMTTAVMPTLLRQDPRYYALGEGSPIRRAFYAASRSFVTRGRGGDRQFNYSEIGGDAVAGVLSNAYYPPGERSVGDVLTRMAIQLIWHTASNQAKEFWPDIRRKLNKKR